MKYTRKTLFTLLSCLLLAMTAVGGSALAGRHAHGFTHHATSTHAHKKKIRPGKARGSQDARKLFAEKTQPAALPVSAIGSYTNGCAAGSIAMPKDGPNWQVMRLSRNRNWGNPRTIKFVEDLAARAKQDGWNGVLVGDMSQPRGGPMPGGHASHNIGLDVDLWLDPAPDHVMTDEERETVGARSVTQIDSADLDMSVWTPATAAFVRDAAQDPNVQRIFITPAAKQYLCQRKDPHGADTWWMKKIRPCGAGSCLYHNDHIHARLTCTKGDAACKGQEDVADDDGCGSELTAAMRATAKDPPFSSKPPGKPHPRQPFPLSRMPAACVKVLNASP